MFMPSVSQHSLITFFNMRLTHGLYVGDIAAFPEPTTGQLARIEHWNVSPFIIWFIRVTMLNRFQVAQNHGRAVASGIAGNPAPFDKVPIFWSAQGQQLRYAGYGVGYDDVFIKGDPNELKVGCYPSNSRCVSNIIAFSVRRVLHQGRQSHCYLVNASRSHCEQGV